MDVRGPVPSGNLKPNELSPVQGETHRVEASGQSIPNDHLQRSSSAEHQRAPEVVRLVSQLKDIPEVRLDVIARVEQSLSDGVYLTRTSSERTAAVLLNLEPGSS